MFGANVFVPVESLIFTESTVAVMVAEESNEKGVERALPFAVMVPLVLDDTLALTCFNPFTGKANSPGTVALVACAPEFKFCPNMDIQFVPSCVPSNVTPATNVPVIWISKLLRPVVVITVPFPTAAAAFCIVTSVTLLPAWVTNMVSLLVYKKRGKAFTPCPLWLVDYSFTFLSFTGLNPARINTSAWSSFLTTTSSPFGATSLMRSPQLNSSFMCVECARFVCEDEAVINDTPLDQPTVYTGWIIMCFVVL